MDDFTEAMILKRIKDSGRAVLNPNLIKQSFGSEEAVAKFLDKHKLKCSEARGVVELRKKER